MVHLDVEEKTEELLTPALLCHKEPARASKAPYLGSLWHKRAGVAIPRTTSRHRGGPLWWKVEIMVSPPTISKKNFPDYISMMKMSTCRVNNGDNTNIRAVTYIVVDDELKVGDVDQGQTLGMLLKS